MRECNLPDPWPGLLEPKPDTTPAPNPIMTQLIERGIQELELLKQILDELREVNQNLEAIRRAGR